MQGEVKKRNPRIEDATWKSDLVLTHLGSGMPGEITGIEYGHYAQDVGDGLEGNTPYVKIDLASGPGQRGHEFEIHFKNTKDGVVAQIEAFSQTWHNMFTR